MKQSPKKKTSITTLLLVLSLPLLYLSLLNTSPSNIIKDDAFWFLLSSSIVFIVAVDSGVFSAPDDVVLHDERIRHNISNGRPLYFVTGQSKSRENVKVRENGSRCLEVDRGSEKIEKVAESVPVEKPALPASSSDEEESEYSKMSDEELNRRVEEFIRRFNRELSSKR